MIDHAKAEYIRKLQPKAIERHCGGYLVISPDENPLRIGVTGDTREDAVAKYFLSLERTLETLLTDEPKPVARLSYSDA